MNQIDRNDPATARDVFERLYPNPAAREACCRVLADTLRFANAQGWSCWSVTLFRDHVRVNVGQVEVLVLSAAEIYLVLDQSSVSRRVMASSNGWLRPTRRVYRSVPTAQVQARIPPAALGRLYPKIGSAHKAFIQHAAEAKRRSPFKESFSPGVVEYLNRALRADLPLPEYWPRGASARPERPRHLVAYHNPDRMGRPLQWDAEAGRSFLTNEASNHYLGCKVWVITGEGQPREYYLIGWYVVDKISRVRTPEFRFRISGTHGVIFNQRLRLSELPWFASFVRSQSNFSLGVQPIEKKYVPLFERLDLGLVGEAENDADHASRRGAGFGDAEENALVEVAAIGFVKACYQGDGWSFVRSVERDRCGFDLLFRNGSHEEHHVEVKGIRSEAQQFMITSGEVRRAHDDPDWVLCVVTNALSRKPSISRYSGSEFKRKFTIEPTQYRASPR